MMTLLFHSSLDGVHVTESASLFTQRGAQVDDNGCNVQHSVGVSISKKHGLGRLENSRNFSGDYCKFPDRGLFSATNEFSVSFPFFSLMFSSLRSHVSHRLASIVKVARFIF
jgi:hypothetical protein